MTWNGVSPGCLDRINAISPATCGAAKLSSTATLVGIAETLEERMWMPPDLSEASVMPRECRTTERRARGASDVASATDRCLAVRHRPG